MEIKHICLKYEVPKATPEEQSLFEECNRVAHWQRGIPGSIVAALLVVGGIKRGLLLTHPNAHHLYQAYIRTVIVIELSHTSNLIGNDDRPDSFQFLIASQLILNLRASPR